ncbi:MULTISPECIES: hypothetical protein [Streptomyces]|uniref:Uncharacterized protein n=1 Tax=Streptomyces canarius TaxID=285453 RepID=A0ABQ3DBB5_9ACTN|nr:hypothetical protein [Streptomyces canarius]GHA69340.1 hypothetical protein GCM10010345_86090 [Streptomyces canarius]
MNHARLVALGRALRLTGEHGRRLEDAASATDVSEIRGDLRRPLMLVDDAIQAAAPTTRCPEHPSGSVDLDAAALGLLCETRHRAGLRTPSRSRTLARTAGKRRCFVCPPATRSAPTIRSR